MANYGPRLKSYPVWTDAEIECVRALYPRSTWAEILAALPGRSRGAIHEKAKAIPIKRILNGKNPWFRDDEEKLKRLYPVATDEELLKEFAPRTLIAIQRQASSLKILRPRPEARSHSRHVLPIIEKLYRTRLGRHMARPELAKKLGYAHGQILAWELGKTNPEFRIVMEWAQALGFEIELRSPGYQVVSQPVAHLSSPRPKLRLVSSCHGCEERDERIHELEAVIREPSETLDPMKIKLTPSEHNLLALFLKRSVWNKDSMFTVLYAADIDAPDDKIIDVYICKIRPKIAPHRITITNSNGGNYSMTETSRARLRSLLVSERSTRASARM